MKSNYLLLATFCLTVAMLVLFLAGAIMAHHHSYFAQDRHFQIDDDDGTDSPENYVNAQWSLTPGAGFVRYFIDISTLATSSPPGATVTPSAGQVRDAVAGWENTSHGDLSSLDWVTAVSAGSADVVVLFDGCDGTLGSFIPQDPNYVEGVGGDDGWHEDPMRKARYWDKAEICFNGAHDWRSADAIQSMMSHEFGHAYGLHEGYRDLPRTGGCGPNDTIMDTIDDEFSTSTHEHCDRITKANYTDVNRVKRFLLDGEVSDTTFSVDDRDAATSTAEITWKDTAWGEQLHEIMIKYTAEEVTDPDRVGFAAMDVAQTYHWYQRVGHHQDIPGADRTPLETNRVVDLTAHRVEDERLPPKTAYVVCVSPYFQAGGPGDADCSDPIWVDNSAHNEALGPPTGTLRLAPGQPTKICYGQTLSLVASDLYHDTSAYRLRFYHPFAPEDADCDTHFQNATGYLDRHQFRQTA